MSDIWFDLIVLMLAAVMTMMRWLVLIVVVMVIRVGVGVVDASGVRWCRMC